ncbi:uncharacterized protein LOC121239472 [Juglans microcarpa x Juglans regia]|uniref:uncharacterized protein LOC121239472 n=1 Tax=Juglans microcarpa x Juglans regia TaxID=2249226 RepID=UPI001B7E4E42|nr:uncharacterized protein LOC121239472 [Juglans microcarpa x Juglans regia]
MYDESKDPLKHLETFKAHMTLHDFSRKIACQVFPLTLKGVVRGWFGALQLSSIDSFEELGRQLMIQFKANRRRRRPPAYLLTVKQRGDESLKAYLTKCNKERVMAYDWGEKISPAALLGGVWPIYSFMTELGDPKTKVLYILDSH